jgi:hypothetical protein
LALVVCATAALNSRSEQYRQWPEPRDLALGRLGRTVANERQPAGIGELGQRMVKRRRTVHRSRPDAESMREQQEETTGARGPNSHAGWKADVRGTSLFPRMAGDVSHHATQRYTTVLIRGWNGRFVEQSVKVSRVNR